jgi:hypothetical protein
MISHQEKDRLRKEERDLLVLTIARKAVGDINALISSQHGIANALALNIPIITKLNIVYWEHVKDFKKFQQYPNHKKISEAKSVAITFYTILREPEHIFRIVPLAGGYNFNIYRWVIRCYRHFENLFIIEMLSAEKKEFMYEFERGTRYVNFSKIRHLSLNSELNDKMLLNMLCLYFETIHTTVALRIPGIVNKNKNL